MLDRQTELERAGRPFPPADLQRLNELESDLALGSLELALAHHQGQPWKGEPTEALRRQRQTTLYRNVANLFLFVLAEARNERLQGLSETWPDLPPICVDGVDLLTADLERRRYEAASGAAVANRFDLMSSAVNGVVVVSFWPPYLFFSEAAGSVEGPSPATVHGRVAKMPSLFTAIQAAMSLRNAVSSSSMVPSPRTGMFRSRLPFLLTMSASRGITSEIFL